MMNDGGMTGVAFALENFGLVLGEAQVVPSAVNIEFSLKMVQRHRRALDVPTGASGPPRRLPCGFVGLGRLPQCEVLVVPLARTRVVHASSCSRANGIDGLARQLTVFGGR